MLSGLRLHRIGWLRLLSVSRLRYRPLASFSLLVLVSEAVLLLCLYVAIAWRPTRALPVRPLTSVMNHVLNPAVKFVLL